tara:strand:- start:466 stop:669 length:204 start_codon:yes stop_codon:yes gene_type:complete
MLKCLISIKDITVKQIFCNKDSGMPMIFATIEDAHKFADKNLIGKKFENIVNKNKVIAFQVLPFGVN